MSDIKSPLYFRSVLCPACGAKTDQAKFKTGMYVEEEREGDQHVVRYRWLQPDVTRLHPPFYALSHCPECAYADFNEDFAEPNRSRENRVRMLVPRLATELARRGSAIGTLHWAITTEPIDFPGALRRHLLAIAIQELLPDEQRDHLKLARLYVRTAWLYREREGADHPQAARTEEVDALDAVAGHLKDLRTAVDHLAAIYAARPGGRGAQALVHETESLSTLFTDLRSALIASIGEGDPLGFLTVVGGDWPEVPTGENPCLEAAIQAFEQVYQRGEGETLPILKLMVDLDYRLGRFDRVLRYTSAMSREGHEERTTLHKRLETDRSLTPDQRARLTVRINQISATLQLAAEIRRETLARQTAPATR